MPDKWLRWENGIEWGKIKCPMLNDEEVMTYYAEGFPCYYSYTAPFVLEGFICYYRFDQDEGCWDEDILFCMEEYQEGAIVMFGNELYNVNEVEIK